MENQLFTSEATSHKRNPFEERRMPDLNYDAAHKTMTDLNKLNEEIQEQLISNPRENCDFHPNNDPQRTLRYTDYGPDGTKNISDETSYPNGDKFLLAYNISYIRNGRYSGREYSILYRTTRNGQRREIKINPSHHLGIAFRSIDGLQIKDINTEGLHLNTNERYEWADAWRNFFQLLESNQAFFDALKKSEFINKGRYLSRDIQPLETDLKTLLDDLENFWNAVYSSKLIKKKFPRDKAPTNLDPPPDQTVSYQDIQRILSFIKDRLAEDIRLLNEHQFPDKPNPYR